MMTAFVNVNSLECIVCECLHGNLPIISSTENALLHFINVHVSSEITVFMHSLGINATSCAFVKPGRIRCLIWFVNKQTDDMPTSNPLHVGVMYFLFPELSVILLFLWILSDACNWLYLCACFYYWLPDWWILDLINQLGFQSETYDENVEHLILGLFSLVQGTIWDSR